MGYAVYAIAVDLDDVRAALGSKDAALLAALTTSFAAGLGQIDEMLVNRLDDPEDDTAVPITAGEVLRHLVMGDPYRADIGFAYGYCLELFCLYFGARQSNSEWSGMRGDWFGAVQNALTAAGVPKDAFSVDTLVYRGPPVPLPTIDDFPGIGYLTRAEVLNARAALAAADLSRVTDKEAVGSIEQVRAWLDECAASGWDLVCTYA